jgi:hypothetical protein
VRGIVQATASHAVKRGIHLRLWYWLSRPTTGVELKAWLRDATVDPAVFGAAQIIYTAAPIFIDRADPLPQRLIEMPGVDVVSTPAPEDVKPPHKAPALRPRRIPDPGGGREAFIALARAAARICEAVEGERHNIIVSETSRLTRIVAAGLLDAAVMRTAMLQAAEQIGTPAAEADAIIDWALKCLMSPRGEISDGR